MRDPMYYSDDSDPAGAGFGRRRRGRRGFGPGGFGPRGGGAPGFGPGPRGFGGGFGRGTFGPAPQEAAEGRDHPHHHGHHHGPDEAAFGPRRFGPGGPGGTDGPGGFGPRGFGPGGFGPGGFGPGPGGFGSGGFGPRGFGPGGFGPGGHGGRRGGRRQRGNVRIAVLALLAEEPRHGYSIMTELAERSGGLWRPSPGSIYPVLQQLQDEGLVTSQDSEGRKVFSLTDAGRTLVTDNPAEYEQPWSMADAGPGLRIKVLFQGMTALGAAVQQVARLGTADQAERAGAVLEEARRNLYRILAEDTAGASLDGSDGPEYGSAGAPSTGPEDDASGDVEQDR